ncbi:MAG: hypothetical protein ACTHN5_20820 [Phycisphaerae bacterium]
MSGDSGHHVAQEFNGTDVVAFTGGHEAKKNGGGVPAGVGPEKGPCASAHRDPPQGAFREVVADIANSPTVVSRGGLKGFFRTFGES